MVAALPESFGDYKLVERLGTGGMAETFVALKRGPAGFVQRVCLKRILPAFESDPAFVGMFVREARLSAMLHHGHIARVLDFGRAEETHYLTLELIEGTDLRALLSHLRRRADALNPRLVAYLAHALASALEFAHTADADGRPAGVVHRDVSPSNVLLSCVGEVKLADFGIAKAMSRPASIQSEALKGKIPYMAPEYAIGRECSARSDLFSLGVLLYECLAGCRPFDGGHDLQTIDRARNGVKEPLGELAPHAPSALVDAVEQLLEPDPDDRPANAAAFLALLEAAPAPVLAQRQLGLLVQTVQREATERTIPVAVSTTRAAPTRRPRKRLRSRM